MISFLLLTLGFFWFFEKVNNIDKPLARLIKKKWEKTQINRIRNEKREVRTDTAEIQRNMRDYYKQLYANKMDNHKEMDKFYEKHNLPRLNQEEMENIKRQSTSTKIETVIKSLPTGLPWWRSGWESACQCRGHGFEPWSGKIPHSTEQLGPWATITEPVRLEPVLRNKRGCDGERPAHHDEECSPLAATRERRIKKTQSQ